MSLLRSPFPTVPTVDPLSRIGGGGDWFTKMNEPILEINFFFSFSQPIETSKATLSLDTPASEASPWQVETSTRVTYHHKYRDSGKRTEIIRISKNLKRTRGERKRQPFDRWPRRRPCWYRLQNAHQFYKTHYGGIDQPLGIFKPAARGPAGDCATKCEIPSHDINKSK